MIAATLDVMTQSKRLKSFNVRLAEAPDAKEITRVINAAFRIAEGFFVDGDRIKLGEVVESMSIGSFVLAERDDELVGCVYVEPRGERAYLGLLSVDPSYQLAGIGSLLMNAGEQHCREQGCRFMDIKIVNLRKELPSFYQRRGYVETGTSDFPADVETTQPCHFIDMAKPLAEG